MGASIDAMNHEQTAGEGDVFAATGVLRVIGFPGTFAAWGLQCVRQVLESGGYSAQVMPLDQEPRDADGPADAVRVLFGHGPVVTPTGSLPARTLVFLDSPAWPLHELLASGCDPVDAARTLTATLAPLASILREEGVLLVQRTSGMDLTVTRSMIAAHISGILALSPDLAADLAVDWPPIDTSGPIPPIAGQALTLLRQTLTPMADLVAGKARNPIVWPLASFYSGDHPSELASSFLEVAGPSRVLYYGPYFSLPRGRWRADVQLIVSGNMHDKLLAVDIFSGIELARHEFKPAQGGLLQASLPFAVRSMEERIEVRVQLLEGAIEGHLGLKQVLLHPLD
jgi:hypothetical protein